MKSLIVFFAAPILALSAFADPTPVLSKTTTNGTVAPQYARVMTCTVSGNGVRVVVTGPSIQFPRPLLKQAVFNDDVPNASVEASLAADAARAPVTTRGFGPIGGGMQSYSVNMGVGQPVDLMVRSGGSVIRENNSQASEKLQAFLDLNCGDETLK